MYKFIVKEKCSVICVVMLWGSFTTKQPTRY